MNRKFNDMHILKLLETKIKKEISKERNELGRITDTLSCMASDRRDCIKLLRRFGKHCKFDPYNYEDIIDPLQTRAITLQNSIALGQIIIKFIVNKRRTKKNG